MKYNEKKMKKEKHEKNPFFKFFHKKLLILEDSKKK
jgi:hypothetical protein